MARPKATVTYTVKDHPGVTITVPGKIDDQKTRDSALDEAVKLMDSGTLNGDSFPSGLGVDDLIFVESSSSVSSAGQSPKNTEEQPLETAAKIVAQFTLKRAALQTQQSNAAKYRELIEAVFSLTPLSEEHLKLALDKEFPKALESLAHAKIEFDALHASAEEAWKLLKPAFSESSSKIEHLEPTKHSTNGTPSKNSPGKKTSALQSES